MPVDILVGTQWGDEGKGKQYEMKKDLDGDWYGVSDPLVVGFHYYFLNVDGCGLFKNICHMF